MIRFLLVFIILFLCSISGFSQISTFTAQASGDWSNTATWSGVGSDADGIPDADDIVIIPAGISVFLSQNSSCDDLVIEFTGIFLFKGFDLTVGGGDIYADAARTITLYLSDPGGNGNFNANSNWLNGTAPPTSGGPTQTCSVPFFISTSFSASFPDIFEGNFTISTEGAMVMGNNNASFRSDFLIGGALSSTTDQNIDDNITIYGLGSIDLSANDLIIGSGFSITFGATADMSITANQITGAGGTNNITNNGQTTFNCAFSNIDLFTNSDNSSVIFSENPTGISSWDVDQTGNTVKYSVASGGAIVLPAGVVYYSFTNTSSTGLSFNTGNDVLGNIEIIGPTTFNGSINVGGNWSQFGGAITHNGTIVFNGSSDQTAFSFVESPVTFNNLTLNNSGGHLIFTDNVQVSDTLSLTNGSVSMLGFTMTVGTSSSNIGHLNYSSGNYVLGSYEKYFAANNPAPENFPVGNLTNGLLLNLDFGTIGTSGSVLVSFEQSAPGNSGLPVTISSSTINNTFTDGYWTVEPQNTFATANPITAVADIQGFTSFPFDSNVRLLVRGASNTWGAGGQSSGSSDGVSITTANSITESLPFDLANGSDISCTVVDAGPISGDTAVCTNDSNVVYTVNQIASTGTSTFLWTVVGGTIDDAGGATTYTAAGDTSISIDWGPNGTIGSITVFEQSENCGYGLSTVQEITIGSILPQSILGRSEVSENATGIVYTLSDEYTGYIYDWSIVGGSITSETQTGGAPATATMTWEPSGTSEVRVTAQDVTNGCAVSDTLVLPVSIYVILDTDNDGQWRDQGGSRWETGFNPSNTESARINNAIYLDQNHTIRNLVIPSVGSLDLDGFTLTVNGALEVEGSIIGPGTIILGGSGEDYYGTPTTTIGTTADNVDIQVISTRTITAGSELSMVGDLTINDNVSLINQGTLIVDGNVISSTNSVLINDAGTALNPTVLEVTGGTFMSSGTLTASANYNTVRYSSNTSAQTVVVPTNANYFNLELSGTTTKSINGLPLNIKGNFISTATDIDEANSTLTFNGTLNQEMSLTNDQLLNNVTFNKSSGTMTVSTAVEVGGILTLTNGVVSNGTNVIYVSNCNTTAITGGGNTAYIDGILERCQVGALNSVFNYPVGTGGDFKRVELIHRTIGRSDFSVQPFNTSYVDVASLSAPLSNVSVLEYWDINRTFGAGSVRVRLWWDLASESEIDDFSDIRVAHYIGGIWVDMQQGAVSTGNPGYVQSALDFASFSPVTFGSTTSAVNPLPIDLLDFIGYQSENNITLEWRLATEFKSDEFIVESSTDFNFGEIGRVKTSEGTENNTFNFIDKNPADGVNYYRLKEEKSNGEIDYSQIIAVNFIGDDELLIYPNPTKNKQLFIRYPELNSELSFELFSPMGMRVHSGAIEFDNSVEMLDLQSFAAGTYILKIHSGKTPLKVFRLVLD